MKTLFIGHYYLFMVAYFFLITTILVAVVYLFRRRWIKDSLIRNAAVNISVSILSTLYILLVLEGLFAYVFVQSDGLDYTLASKRWFYRYWNPINSYNYRDVEPVWRDKITFVVGDSFVAGHGIKNINNRFSNLLANKLGSNWTVTTLAHNGWNPKDYINALTRHHKIPDVIIISYVLNDIQSAISSRGIKEPSLINNPNKAISPFVNHSYFGNWVYWRIYRGILSSDTFWIFLRQSYGDREIWDEHTRELDALINYAEKIDAKIAFIIWPNLSDVRGSKNIASKVYYYLVSKGITVLDLTKYYEKRNPKDLIVNIMDQHPNEMVNAEVAQLLYQTLAPWD